MRLADAYPTGSSLMPQKKNPDSLGAESFDYEKGVEMTSARGGTSKFSVLQQIKVLKAMPG